MPDRARILDDCLKALKEQRNLVQVLRRFPRQRDEMVSLLRLSVQLSELSPAPAADPAFRLKARNRMLGLAAERRAGRWSPSGVARRLAARPGLRLALSGVAVAALAIGGLTAAAAGSLPGQPLYGYKTGLEEVRLALTLDPNANAQLRLSFAQRRLDEAKQLIARGQVAEGVSLVDQYDRAVGQADKSLAAAAIDDRAAAATARYLGDRQAQADAQLQALAGTLESGGDSQAAGEVARARSHSDGALAARQEKLRARGDPGGRPADQPSGQDR